MCSICAQRSTRSDKNRVPTHLFGNKEIEIRTVQPIKWWAWAPKKKTINTYTQQNNTIAISGTRRTIFFSLRSRRFSLFTPLSVINPEEILVQCVCQTLILCSITTSAYPQCFCACNRKIKRGNLSDASKTEREKQPTKHSGRRWKLFAIVQRKRFCFSLCLFQFYCHCIMHTPRCACECIVQIIVVACFGWLIKANK